MANIKQITLPSGSTYNIVDIDGRKMIASNFDSTSAYSSGDYVVYQDKLYRITANASANAGWENISKVEATVGAELKAIKATIVGGIHYKGYTTTALTDGATTNPITINGDSYTAIAGDLVIYERTSYRQVAVTSSTFKTDGTFANSDDGYLYTKSGSTYTKVTSGSYNSATTYYGTVIEGIEYLYDGSIWNEFGSSGTLKAMAFCDTASGSASVSTSVTGTASAQTFTGSQATITISGSTTGVDVSMTVGSSNKTSITPFASGGSFTQGSDTFTQGSLPSFTQGSDTFTQGSLPSFTQGTDTFSATVTSEVLTINFTQGSDTWSAGSLASFTQGSDTWSAGSLASFTQGSDSFTPASGGTAKDVLISLPTPSVTQGSFSGSTTYTPQGSNSTSSVSGTGSGTVSVTVSPDIS